MRTQLHNLRVAALTEERDVVNRTLSENAKSGNTPTPMNHSLLTNSSERNIAEQTINFMLDSIELHLKSK